MDFDCGIAFARIAGWLNDELCLPRECGHWIFRVGAAECVVEAEALEPRTFSQLSLERTHLVAYGDNAAVDALNKLFTLRFMSAGG